MEIRRCGWVKLNDPLYVAYHDEEWGKPLHDDRALFELFSLETQAAGLSWLTVLKKREGYREAFEGFDLDRVAAYDDAKIDAIVQSGLVVKSRPKIAAIVANAQGFVEIRREFGSLDAYFWGKIGGTPIVNDVADHRSAACHSEVSDQITKELKQRGFKFVGNTTVYAFLQSCGMIDDHENGCAFKTR